MQTFAQDAQFSQFYASSLYLNPALAGSEPDIAFASNFRQQWRSIVQPYTTTQFSVIVPYHAAKIKDSHKGGAGISFYNDRAGDGKLNTMGVNLTAAYNITLSHNGLNYLSFGLQAGIIQKSVDFSQLQWGSQYNASLGFDPSVPVNQENFYSNRLYADINSGLIYYHNAVRNYQNASISAYVGVSAYHMNRPNEAFLKGTLSRLPVLGKFHAGLEWNVAPKLNISPNTIVFYQNARRQINTGFYLSYAILNSYVSEEAPTSLILGGWYRLEDAFIASIGVSGSFYTVGFSYDVNNSGLRNYTQGRGAYELSLTLRRNTKNRIKKFATPRI